MASLKDIKRKIAGVKQTQKLTKAMNMVAAAKLRSTQGLTEGFRAYAVEHGRLLHEIARRAGDVDHPLFAGREGAAPKVGILAFSSDRGLCGSFNTNLFHALDKKIVELRQEGSEVSLFLVGRKLGDYYKRRKVEISHAMTGVMGNFDYPLAKEIAKRLMDSFMAGDVKATWLLTTRFYSVARQEVEMSQLLPLSRMVAADPGQAAPAAAGGGDFLIEPGAAAIFGRLIPKSLTHMVYQAMLESATSENAARMQAMDNASKNCKEITDSLTLEYNKIRQASVTNELLDIVNGSEALSAA